MLNVGDGIVLLCAEDRIEDERAELSRVVADEALEINDVDGR